MCSQGDRHASGRANGADGVVLGVWDPLVVPDHLRRHWWSGPTTCTPQPRDSASPASSWSVRSSTQPQDAEAEDLPSRHAPQPLARRQGARQAAQQAAEGTGAPQRCRAFAAQRIDVGRRQLQRGRDRHQALAQRRVGHVSKVDFDEVEVRPLCEHVVGQVPRIVASILFSRLWVPRGNSGRARVSAFKPMPVPADLRHLVP